MIGLVLKRILYKCLCAYQRLIFEGSGPVYVCKLISLFIEYTMYVCVLSLVSFFKSMFICIIVHCYEKMRESKYARLFVYFRRELFLGSCDSFKVPVCMTNGSFILKHNVRVCVYKYGFPF